MGCGISYYFGALYSFLMMANIELLWGKTFSGGRKAGVWGGGGGGGGLNWSLGLGEIQGFTPLNETLVCVCGFPPPPFFFFFFGWLR